MRLHELTSKPTSRRLLDHLKSPHAGLIASEPTDLEAPLESVIEHADRIRSELPKTAWDAALAVEVHRCLSGLPNRLLTRMSFWHWMTTGPFRAFTVERWLPTDPSLMDEMKAAEVRRFLGSPTLNGVARNALARLYWGADGLHDDAHGYELVGTVLSNQDFYQQIFDRRFGLHPPAAKAFAIAHTDSSEKERRDAAVRLNFLFSTIAVEQLDEDEVAALL